jgi:hypothetical protein
MGAVGERLVAKDDGLSPRRRNDGERKGGEQKVRGRWQRFLSFSFSYSFSTWFLEGWFGGENEYE